MLLSCLVAGGCFYWIFHGVDLQQLGRSLEDVNWWRLPVVVVLDVAAYLLVAVEWQLLLRPVGRFGFRAAVRAVFAGRFANDVLPVQLGYVIRIFMASRSLGKSVSAVVPSLLIERMLDGWWLGVGIVLLTFFVTMPGYIIRARNILGSVLLAGAALLLAMTLSRRKHAGGAGAPLRAGWRLLGSFESFFGRVVSGVRAIGGSHVLPAVVVLSALKLMVQGLAYYGVIWMYGLQISVWTGLAVFLIAYLGITVPSTPASAGVFQFFSVLGLELFGVPKLTASGLSLVAFVVLTAPLAAAGAWAVATSGMKWRELRSELDALRERMREHG